MVTIRQRALSTSPLEAGIHCMSTTAETSQIPLPRTPNTPRKTSRNFSSPEYQCPPSSSSISSTTYGGTNDSTLSIQADQGPRPQRTQGWVAFSGVIFQHANRPAPQSQPQSTALDSDEEDVSPKKRTHAVSKVCPLCLSTRLQKGRQFCQKCTKKQKRRGGTLGEVAPAEELPLVRPQYEIEMLQAGLDESLEMLSEVQDEDKDWEAEFLQVVSDDEEVDEEEEWDGEYGVEEDEDGDIVMDRQVAVRSR